MRLAQFITANSKRIISEWEQFARTCLPAANAMDIDQRRDHVAGMLKAIAVDLDIPQTKREQVEKSKGNDDAEVGTDSPANAHGTDRAATGYTPAQMVAEFRALRASVLRLWAEAQSEFNRANLDEVTRFNESIDQLLAESMASYAQDVDRSKDLFLGVLGHDLRNPLGAIVMSATAMMTAEGPGWRHSKTVARIVTSGTRMGEMIGDLLDITRARLGAGIPIERSEIDLETVCRETVDEIAAFHPGSIVHFEASGPLRGQWDRGRIAQVMSNLVGNAYQHGATNEPIEVALRGEPDRVVLTVQNQGPVIAKRDLQDIFNPFRQLRPAHGQVRDRGSLGLGLYIAEAIVSAHHGTIDVESTERGTTFTVGLPRKGPANR
jgi:signal transduction histidine kinase